MLQRSGRLVLPSVGGSMLPAIWPGDALVVEAATCSNVGLGDIVLFSNAYRFAAHRVVEKDGETKRRQVRSRGDGRSTGDAPIMTSQILGKVSFIVRNGRCFEPTK